MNQFVRAIFVTPVLAAGSIGLFASCGERSSENGASAVVAMAAPTVEPARPALEASSVWNTPDAVAPGDATDGAVTDTGSDADAPSTTEPPRDSIATIDPQTVAHVRELLTAGAARGNRREVFAKLGDSITESASFLQDCGRGWYELGAHTELEDTIAYFSAVMFDPDTNSFSRTSLSATAGWAVADALAGGDADCPVARELDAIHPAWAVIMYGTNDLDRSDLATYSANLAHLVDLVERHGVVAILSTVPPRTDRPSAAALVDPFNAVIRALATTRHTPWVDYWRVMSTAPGQGASSDGIHPSIYRDDEGLVEGCYFTPPALRYGYNLRNLTAIQVLARVRSL